MEMFHEELRKKLRNIAGVLDIHDDIIVGGEDTDDHVRALKATFQVIKENNLTLNKKKCEFNKSSIKFFSLIFLSDCIYPGLEKVTSLDEANVPKNKDKLRLFLVMTNFSSMFIENYSSITAELRKLLASKNHLKFKKQFKGPLYVKLF